ncbi:hypothetical protein PFISCL1PPCAC_20776, partial [Pristionchus fissidentatus]
DSNKRTLLSATPSIVIPSLLSSSRSPPLPLPYRNPLLANRQLIYRIPMCFGGGKKPHNTATTTTSLNGKLYTCSDSAKEVSAHSTLSMPRSRNAHASSPSTYTGPSNTRTRTSPMQHQPAVPAPPPPLPPPPVKNTTLLYKPSVEVEPTPVDAVEQTAKSQDREDGVAKSCHTWKSNKLTEDDLPTLKIIEDPGPREAANERTNNNTEASCSEWSVSVTKHLKPDEKKGGKAQPRRQLKEILAAAGGPKTIVTRTHTQPTQGDDDRLDRTQKISNTVRYRNHNKYQTDTVALKPRLGSWGYCISRTQSIMIYRIPG